jgi:hypothetical protein
VAEMPKSALKVMLAGDGAVVFLGFLGGGG